MEFFLDLQDDVEAASVRGEGCLDGGDRDAGVSDALLALGEPRGPSTCMRSSLSRSLGESVGDVWGRVAMGGSVMGPLFELPFVWTDEDEDE
jgi:hypothetical protein